MKGGSDTSVTLEVGITATMDTRLSELRSASGINFAASDERKRLEISSAMEHTQAATVANGLEGLATPCLVLDVERMERNIARLRAPVVRGGSDKVEAEWPRFGGWQ